MADLIPFIFLAVLFLIGALLLAWAAKLSWEDHVRRVRKGREKLLRGPKDK